MSHSASKDTVPTWSGRIREYAGGLGKYPWFASCGTAMSDDIGCSFRMVKSISELRRTMKSRLYENATLAPRNLITEHLSRNYRERDREWNAITDAAKSAIEPIIGPIVTTRFGADPGFQDIYNDVSWNILAGCMVYIYCDCDLPTHFFSDMLRIYAAGHMPCGWEGSKWPNGNLIIF